MDVVLGVGLSVVLIALYAYIIIGMIKWYRNYPKE